MNTKVYEEYELRGVPNHFYTVEATEKYNNKLTDWCNNLNVKAKDLTLIMRVKRKLYICYLDIFDVIQNGKCNKIN